MGWYVCTNMAEGVDYSVVELSDDEFKAVRKCLDNMTYVESCDGGYGGSFGVSSTRFETREEAVDSVMAAIDFID